MAESPEALQLLFSLSSVALLASATLLLAFGRPVTLPKRLAALVLGLYAARQLGAALLGEAAAGRYFGDVTVLVAWALLGLLAVYPSRVRLRSGHGALLAAAVVATGAYTALFLGARAFPGGAWQGALGLATLALSAATLAVLAAGLLRAAALPPGERRGALLVMAGLAAGLLARPGFTVATLLQAAGSGLGPLEALLAAALAPEAGVTLALLSGWAALPLSAWLVARHRSLAAAALAGYGALRVGIEALPGALNAFPLFTAILALALLHALHRDGAFATPSVPPVPGHVAGGAALVTGFFVALVVGIQLAGDSALGLAATTFLALLAGMGALLVADPPLLGAARRRPPGEERLGPYRAALAAELGAGAAPGAVLAKLRGLRRELGITDAEHAIIESTLRSAQGSPAPDAQAHGGAFAGRYRVLRELGRGSFGATYLCRDELVDRDVVLKRIRAPAGSPEGLDAVLREARAMGGLRHPGVVTLHDVQRVGDEAFIVMEHVEGGSLADRLARGPLAPEEFHAVAGGMLGALGAVHAAGIVHRDVKPSNVLLTRSGGAKLADFGVAHLRGFEATAGGDSAGGGAVVGTIRFMSPEQAKGRRATPQSDLFSAAATLYEAYTGRAYLSPRPGETPTELQMRAARAGRFAVDVGPPAVRAWFAQGLDPDPSLRFGSAAEMLDGLDRATGGARGLTPA